MRNNKKMKWNAGAGQKDGKRDRKMKPPK